MAFRAAVRFNYKEKGKRGPVDWYNPHDVVPEDVAEFVDARCVYDDSGVLAGFPAGGSIDAIAEWVLQARERPDDMLARAEGARDVEAEGKRRKGLLNFLDDQIRNLSDSPPDEGDAGGVPGDEG